MKIIAATVELSNAQISSKECVDANIRKSMKEWINKIAIENMTLLTKRISHFFSGGTKINTCKCKGSWGK